jgi:hypothetical protein
MPKRRAVLRVMATFHLHPDMTHSPTNNLLLIRGLQSAASHLKRYHRLDFHHQVQVIVLKTAQVYPSDASGIT